jgi:hypothetical protein
MWSPYAGYFIDEGRWSMVNDLSGPGGNQALSTPHDKPVLYQSFTTS